MRKRSRFLRFAAHGKTVSSFGRNDDCFGLGKKNRAPGHFGLVNSKKARADKRGVLASWAEGDFQVVDRLAVADALELAVELGGGVVRVAVFFFVVGFGLALFCGVVEVGLGQGLEREEDEAEGGGGGVEASVVFVGGLFSAVLEALEEKYGREERQKGEKGAVNDEVEVHGRPFAAGVAQAWIGAPMKAAAMFPIAGRSGFGGRRTLEEGGP